LASKQQSDGCAPGQSINALAFGHVMQITKISLQLRRHQPKLKDEKLR
jgi:hypothetical protein